MPKKICIFGASGATGQILTAKALKRGHQVTAFVRSENAARLVPQGATLKIGDLLEQEDVNVVVAGMDVVISAIGPRPGSSQEFCAAATRNIVSGMKNHGAKRLVCITGAMIGEYPHLSWMMQFIKSIYQRQNPRLARDRTRQEVVVMHSDLDWLIVKPPRLTNGPQRAHYQSGEALPIHALSSISRADLSTFIMGEISTPKYRGLSVAVSY